MGTSDGDLGRPSKPDSEVGDEAVEPAQESGRGDAVQRFLRSFGASAAAARRVAAAGESLRVRAQRNGIEFAATFDAATGTPLGAVLTGGSTEVGIGQHIRAMVAGRSYVTLHTHPASTPPSPGDAAVLVLNPPIELVAVVGANGTWYALSPAPGTALATDTSVRMLFAAAFLALRPRYVALGRARHMADNEIMAALVDAIWRTIAPALGLQYDRLERTSDGNHTDAVAGPEDSG